MKLATLAMLAILSAAQLRALVHEANHLAHVRHPSSAQRKRESHINALFERDMRARDIRAELDRENGR